MAKKYPKKQGEIVWGFANGIDLSPVLDQPAANKGYGNSTTTPYDVTDIPTTEKVLLALSETVGSRLRSDEVEIEVIAIGIRYANLEYVSHQKQLLSATNLTIEIYHTACKLFSELWNGMPIRHLGIHTSKAQEAEFARQMLLFDNTDYDKLARMDATVDNVRSRYGIDSIMRATFINQPLDHMSGGISREKRTVDYSTITIQ